MSTISFSLSRFPRIEMADGAVLTIPEKVLIYGSRVLLITGKSSFYQSPRWYALLKSLQLQKISYMHTIIDHEPSPQQIDRIVSQFANDDIMCVVAIGGGSVLDAGKAVSGLLKVQQSVMDYLEGVGKGENYPGPAVPFIAVPTTAGTGSEATKNAVLSQMGKDGFKKSFRDERLIPEYALIDPELLESCPKALIAANGMDALTQLLESYVSSKANPFTDALALSGLEAVRDSLLIWYRLNNDNSAEVKQAREKMAYAALLSGITLAQVGLGSVHGVAAPLGAFFPIPHGVACGTLLAAATRINIAAMQSRDQENVALIKYATIGRLLTRQPHLSPEQALQQLIELLTDWTRKMSLQGLSAYGVTDADIPLLVSNSQGNSMKTNPIVLKDEEIAQLLRSRLQ